MKKLNRWYRRYRFITAYKILRNEYERHLKAGHVVQFEAINEAHIIMICTDCPELLP